jgi:hypothetical protein
MELGSWLAWVVLAAPVFLAVAYAFGLDDRLDNVWGFVVWMAIAALCTVVHARLVTARSTEAGIVVRTPFGRRRLYPWESVDALCLTWRRTFTRPPFQQPAVGVVLVGAPRPFALSATVRGSQRRAVALLALLAAERPGAMEVTTEVMPSSWAWRMRRRARRATAHAALT